ncbi:MAG: hypothetical protein JWO03_2226, partial [Bacteroidetes bacterium]|nr:hypothetical protein [Bacteroidota bacterium]
MKQLNPACFGLFFRRLVLFSLLLSAVSFVHAQCVAPVSAADYYTLYNDRPNTLNVSANDTNTVGSALTVTILHLPSHGTATLTGNEVIFRGNGIYAGPDTFSYVVCDSCPSHNCDTGYVYLNIVACISPRAVTDRITQIQGDVTSTDVSANDSSVISFGNVTVTLLNGTAIPGSSVILSGRTVTYVASATQTGIDTITYRICTDCGCDFGLAIFTVTQAPCRMPAAVDDVEYAGYSSLCSSIYNVLGNDTMPVGGGNVVVTIATPPTFGTATIVNNQVVYTCTDSTRVGQIDVVRYSLCNACFCDTGVVAIHIANHPCNGLNPNVGKDTAYVCRNYPVSIPVTANDVDPEGTTVTLDTIVGAALHGTARKTNSTTITYTPVAGFTGHDFFVYRACDGGTPKLCNIATVDVFVRDCNSPPIILNAANNPADTLHVSVYEDSFMTYCFHYTQADSPYVFISHIGTSIDTITPTAGSTTAGIAPCVRIAVPYQSRTTQTVEVVICNNYPLCDTVQMIISVVPINHRPHALPDFLYYNTTGCGPIFPLVNDYDDDLGDIINVTAFDTITLHGGTVTYDSVALKFCYMPDASFAGLDTFYYTICDTSHLCTSSYVVVSVPLLARPDHGATLQDQSVSIDILANDSHTPNQYVTLCNQPLHGMATLDSAGVTYTPDHDYPIDPINPDTSITQGVDSFCYTLCSISGTDTTCARAEVVVTVAAKSKFNIPQGISPNGDGVNDKFVIPSVEELPKSQLLVYNRYGDEVWRNDAEGYQNDFDGTWKKNGQPLPDMSYWYIFKYNDGVHADRMGY